MRSYLEQLTSHIDGLSTAGSQVEIVPGLCPLLYYSLVPYIVSIADGAQFGWMRYTADTQFRRKILKCDFSRKDVNRLYPNEIIVRCPNHASKVVCGVGPYGDGVIKVRILDAESSCPKSHKPGEEFLLLGDQAHRARNFNRSFPRLVCDAFGLKESRGDNSKIGVSIEDIIFPCRYSRAGQKYTWPFSPDGFCLHLFQAIYPEVLSCMYGGRVPERFEVPCHCQSTPLGVSIKKVSKRRPVFSPVLDIAEGVFERFFYPFDRIDYDINVKIDGKIPGGCAIASGREYAVNMGDQRFICPSALHFLYPYLLLAERDTYIEWSGDSTPGHTIPCPDCVGTLYAICPRSEYPTGSRLCGSW
ncbi:hypothetical protein A3D58_04340 [Candidatus Uhrbacteria bacterium RIFCSPHIGHO2_02_FULL_46_47]|nr:MAG: hypothetical protein A3D58_04340 [Candidatus Uhrbacteria bacterium RIFCSPHIGHO2_02_FULL_46_47]